MPIRQDDNQPNRRFGIVNIILIGVGALLLFSSLFPNQNMQIPRVPYQSNCIQEIITFIAPKILGGENSMNPFGDFEFEEIDEVINLSDSQFSLIGNDICVKSSFKN